MIVRFDMLYEMPSMSLHQKYDYIQIRKLSQVTDKQVTQRKTYQYAIG